MRPFGLFVALAAVSTTGACGYLHHRRGQDQEPDGAATTDAQWRDGDGPWDAGDGGWLPPDGAADTGLDGAMDADVDAQVDGGSPRGCVVPDSHPSLQAALDDPACDPIRVRGTAWLAETAQIRRDVTITSISAETVATLQGVGGGRVLRIDSNQSVTLEHLAVTGGLAHEGGGIYSEGHITLRHTWIGNNRTSRSDTTSRFGGRGAGLFQRGGSIHLEVDNVFANNHCDGDEGPASGGAMYLEDTTLVGTGMLVLQDNLVTSARFVSGGAITSMRSDVRAANIRIINNEAACTGASPLAFGGALQIEGGQWALDNLVISDNTARAEAVGDGSAQSEGGAVFCQDGGVIAFHDGVASNNQAIALGSDNTQAAVSLGGFIASINCPVTLSDMNIGGNHADANVNGSHASAKGGAVSCIGTAPVHIEHVTMDGNFARGHLAGMAPIDTPSQALGGAISADGCNLSIVDTLLEGNRAEIEADTLAGDSDVASGGGLVVEGDTYTATTVDVQRTTFFHNEATATPNDNAVSVRGGGICVTGRSTVGLALNLTNTTIAANSAHVDPDAPNATATGGGIDVTLTDPTFVSVGLFNVTVTLNQAIASHPRGTGIHQDTTTGVVRTRNSIIWGNPSEPGFDAGECRSNNGTLSDGNNLLADGCGALISPPTDRFQDPGLQPVTTCGDHCRINPLTVNSAAINLGNANACTGPDGAVLTTDQRGQPRTDRCDVGAFEL